MQGQKKIIGIAGDSLSMVNSEEELLYEELYPYRLQMKLGEEFHLIVRNRRANNSSLQFNWLNLHDDILCNNSRYQVIHIGISDCAPKLISRPEDIVMRLLGMGGYRNFYIRFKSRHRRFFTKLFRFQKVPLDKFIKNFTHAINEIREKTKIKKVFVLGICDTNDLKKRRSFNIEKHINDYNNALMSVVNLNKDLSEYIDMYSQSRKDMSIMFKDGMHINQKGHELIASILFERIMLCEEAEH